MEDKMAWRRVHAELVENHRLAQDMSATVAQSRACCTELLACFTTDRNSSSYTGGEDKTEGGAGGKGELRCLCAEKLSHFEIFKNIILILLAAGEGLTHASVMELIQKLNSHEEQLGKMV